MIYNLYLPGDLCISLDILENTNLDDIEPVCSLLVNMIIKWKILGEIVPEDKQQ